MYTFCGFITTIRPSMHRGDRSTSSGRQELVEVAAAGTAVAVAVQRRSDRKSMSRTPPRALSPSWGNCSKKVSEDTAGKTFTISLAMALLESHF